MRAPLVVALLSVVALAGCSGGGADADGDGLSDRNEKRGWTIYVDLLGHRVARQVTSDPSLYDTDNDGLSDQDEYLYPSTTGRAGLDARSDDTDEDGLTDCQEALHTVLEDCEDPDFPGPYDGGYGTLPFNADSEPTLGRYWNGLGPAYVDDTDSIHTAIGWGDGLSDGAERDGFTMTIGAQTLRVTTDPLSSDTDRDNVDDGLEILLFNSNPMVPDTDGDGCADARDPVPDREELYVLGLQSFLLKTDHDLEPAKGADLHLVAVFTDRTFELPASGGKSVPVGEQVSIADLDPPAQPPNCGAATFPPSVFHPWMYLGFAAFDEDGTQRERLDVSSTTDVAVYWNVRTGMFSWNSDGTRPFPGPAKLTGADGEISVAPRVL